MSYFRQGRSFARYAVGLRSFLGRPLSSSEARRRIVRQLDERSETFSNLIVRGVFDNPTSPYRPLFDAAGIEHGDVDHLLHDKGVEGALDVLYDAGVSIRLEEFKGRAAVERTGLSYGVTAEQFDNPLLDPVHSTRTSGSSGNPTAVQLDLSASEHEAAYMWLFLEAHGARDHLRCLWRPVPPGSAGLNNMLSLNKLGLPVDRWFTQTWPGRGLAGAAERAFIHWSLMACRRWGAGVGPIEHVPLDQSGRVAAWLGEMVNTGTPPMLSAPASSAVRVAQAATAQGWDLTGTLMRTGGEPLTDAKAAAIARSGAKAVTNYAITEAGRLGLGCATPEATDDVHLLTDKTEVIQRDVDVNGSGVVVPALFLTTLHTACRKIMINVEVGDYGVLERRRCGCAAGQLGLDLHLRGIRSYDKLTSEGMSFLGSELVTLVEDDLPRRFGGSVGDYQIVESEVDGLPTISIRVRTAVGILDEDAVVRFFLEALRRGPSYKHMMTAFLADGRTVRVVRGEPHATAASKIPALHIVRP